MITLYIAFDNLLYPIPVNPKDLAINQSASNANIDIIGLGKATRKGDPGLRTLQIKSFFPSPNSRYYNGKSAGAYIEFLNMIWQTDNVDNKVAHIYSEGLKDSEIASNEIDMLFVIEKFEYRYVGGDFDTEYSLSIKEYVPYGVYEIQKFSEGMQSARAPSTVKANVPGLMQDVQPTTQAKTYTISSGDTLWTIAKRATGDGSNWKALYELNKDAIGTNPNRIYSGTVLTLPENWNSPQAIKNTGTKQKVYTSGSNKDSGNSNSEKFEKSKKVTGTGSGVKSRYAVGGEAERAFEDYSKVYEDNKVEFERFLNQRLKNDKGEVNQNSIWYKSTNSAYQKSQQNHKQAEKILNDYNTTEKEKAVALRELKTSEIAIANRIGDLQWINQVPNAYDKYKDK